MRNFWAVFFILILNITRSLAGYSEQGFNYSSGTDTLWIHDNLIVPEGQTLDIAPGTVVLFDGSWFIEIRGKIRALGTEQEPIVFKPADTLGFSDTLETRGSWHGLRFVGTNSEKSEFHYCQFWYAKALDSDSLLKCGGVVHARGAVSALFDNCLFQSNRAWSRGGAIALFDGADLEFRHCSFIENATYNTNEGYGGAVYVWNASPIFYQCTFSDNQAVWTGGAICLYYSNPLIHNCLFTGNFGYIGGGMAFYHCRPQRTICNNILFANVGLYFGGGISCNNACDPVFVNNTIVLNSASYGGGFYCNDSAAPTIINSLIYNNINYSGLGPVYIWDPLSHPNFHYCNIQGGSAAFAGSGGGSGYWGVFSNNIDIPPMFDSTVSWLYYPADTSLVDRGTPASDTLGLNLPSYDFAGDSRFVNGRVDIGAYERSGVKIEQIIKGYEVSVFPNPATDRVTFSLQGLPAGNFEIWILDSRGKRVFHSSETHLGGVLNYSMDLHCFSQGLYILRVKGRNWFGSALIIKE
ncbi:MAG: T9SS type A sorting domain-containing protein [Bacteroidales bacterium]|jgi:hypothetical protein|nr:T9SS type A sorting domain-containing protein [Bacteroidales bacterium]NPV36811.1 T9SS type A sorting domain-containing protein [Bacteroidales bacterium]